MPEYSKFRVITAGFILMFIFVIAAMYSNTKDIAAQKVKNAEPPQNNINYNKSSYPKTETNTTKISFKTATQEETYTTEDEIGDLTDRIEQLEKSYDVLKREVATTKTALSCRIRGILDNDEVVPLPVNESIEEARINDRELVITCEIR